MNINIYIEYLFLCLILYLGPADKAKNIQTVSSVDLEDLLPRKNEGVLDMTLN